VARQREAVFPRQVDGAQAKRIGDALAPILN
jgi:hypothetical protein